MVKSIDITDLFSVLLQLSPLSSTSSTRSSSHWCRNSSLNRFNYSSRPAPQPSPTTPRSAFYHSRCPASVKPGKLESYLVPLCMLWATICCCCCCFLISFVFKTSVLAKWACKYILPLLSWGHISLHYKICSLFVRIGVCGMYHLWWYCNCFNDMCKY